MKKLTAALLALVMALTLCTAAWAATPTADYSWYIGETTDTYTISSDAQLLAFANIVNGTDGQTAFNFAGKVVKLAKDIDLGGMTWTPIGTTSTSFEGEFDGQSHTVKNFKIDASATGAQAGFFNGLGKSAHDGPEQPKVHDFTLQNVTATVGAGAHFGTLACRVYSEYYSKQPKLENVNIKSVTVTVVGGGSDTRIGGICHWADTGVCMANCSVSDLTVIVSSGDAGYIGGFTAISNVMYYCNRTKAKPFYNNCDVNNFTVNCNSNSSCAIGGLIAQTQVNSSYFTFENCDIAGLNITASGVATVGGFVCSPGGIATATNCSVQGSINVAGLTEGYAGGFYADYGWGVEATQQINNCRTNVNIVTHSVPAGGLVGNGTDANSEHKTAKFENCTVSGNITSTGTASVGGLAGTADRGTFEECTTTGKVNNAPASPIGKVADNTFVVTLKCGDDNNNINKYIVRTGEKVDLSDYVPTKTGHTFHCWQTEDGTEWNTDVPFEPSSNVVLIAHWDVNNYTVTFNTDGGEGTVSNQTVAYGAKVSAPDEVTKEGYTFDGWYNGTTKWNFDTDTMGAKDMTLTAHWTINTYTVTYSAGKNGSGTVAAGTKTYGVEMALNDTGFTRSGYTQIGWATTDGGEKVYDMGGKYTANEAVTLYPVWQRNAHGIYRPQGGSSATTTPAVNSPKTADAGIAVYGLMAVSSVLGMGVVGKKKF